MRITISFLLLVAAALAALAVDRNVVADRQVRHASSGYETNLTWVWDPPEGSSNDVVYELAWVATNLGSTNSVTTQETNATVTVSTANRYVFAVRCAYTNDPDLWSPYCPAVTWTVGTQIFFPPPKAVAAPLGAQ